MIVTVVHTPNSFWAQPVTTADTVRDFSAKMKEYFLTNSSSLGLITLKRTMKVAAKLVPYLHTYTLLEKLSSSPILSATILSH